MLPVVKNERGQVSDTVHHIVYGIAYGAAWTAKKDVIPLSVIETVCYLCEVPSILHLPKSIIDTVNEGWCDGLPSNVQGVKL